MLGAPTRRYHHNRQLSDAYECQREAIEQADRALNPKEARLDFEIKRRMSLGTTRCVLSSLEHRTMPTTVAGISPTLLLLSASLVTPMPEDKPEEAKIKDDSSSIKV